MNNWVWFTIALGMKIMGFQQLPGIKPQNNNICTGFPCPAPKYTHVSIKFKKLHHQLEA